MMNGTYVCLWVQRGGRDYSTQESHSLILLPPGALIQYFALVASANHGKEKRPKRTWFNAPTVLGCGHDNPHGHDNRKYLTLIMPNAQVLRATITVNCHLERNGSTLQCWLLVPARRPLANIRTLIQDNPVFPIVVTISELVIKST